jgi:excisionase family DNA binding protein
LSQEQHLSIRLSAELIEEIAVRAADLAAAKLCEATVLQRSPYMAVAEAAEMLRCRPQRIYDLLSQRRLSRIKDGRRTLVLRNELEAYLRGEPTGARTTPPRRRAA